MKKILSSLTLLLLFTTLSPITAHAEEKKLTVFQEQRLQNKAAREIERFIEFTPKALAHWDNFMAGVKKRYPFEVFTKIQSGFFDDLIPLSHSQSSETGTVIEEYSTNPFLNIRETVNEKYLTFKKYAVIHSVEKRASDKVNPSTMYFALAEDPADAFYMLAYDSFTEKFLDKIIVEDISDKEKKAALANLDTEQLSQPYLNNGVANMFLVKEKLNPEEAYYSSDTISVIYTERTKATALKKILKLQEEMKNLSPTEKTPEGIGYAVKHSPLEVKKASELIDGFLEYNSTSIDNPSTWNNPDFLINSATGERYQYFAFERPILAKEKGKTAYIGLEIGLCNGEDILSEASACRAPDTEAPKTLKILQKMRTDFYMRDFVTLEYVFFGTTK